MGCLGQFWQRSDCRAAQVSHKSDIRFSYTETQRVDGPMENETVSKSCNELSDIV